MLCLEHSYILTNSSLPPLDKVSTTIIVPVFRWGNQSIRKWGNMLRVMQLESVRDRELKPGCLVPGLCTPSFDVASDNLAQLWRENGRQPCHWSGEKQQRCVTNSGKRAKERRWDWETGTKVASHTGTNQSLGLYSFPCTNCNFQLEKWSGHITYLLIIHLLAYLLCVHLCICVYLSMHVNQTTHVVVR